jgi:hypothetical protein
MLHEEIGRILWQGEHVYYMLAHNTLSSTVNIDQLAPLLPTDNEEINTRVKHFHAMLDTATMTGPTLH